jgi:hypothetical protein
MHPLLQELLIQGLRAGGRAAAKAADSMLEDASRGLEGATRRVSRARRTLRRRVEESIDAIDGAGEPRVEGQGREE